MASLPPVKLDTHEDWFNLLMTVLHQQAEQNPYEEYREMAHKLIDQFMRYGRPFVDSDHAPCVALRMYPKEAGNIEELVKDRTVVMIAHKLKTIAGADQIIVLDQGEVKEVGTHKALMNNHGLYRHLWDIQQTTAGWQIN